jgi:nicotinate-nucleotide--dimethylbenzimidazole phosphoribosyltransferase
VGRGTGVDDEALHRKRAVVAAAILKHADGVVDVWDCLSRLGGYEILGLAGLALGAARNRLLVVLDGLISSTAGLVAARLNPAIRGYLVASSLSPEPGHRFLLDALDLKPLLDLGLRLGEGTGAALALPLIHASADILRNMATFDAAGVSEPAPKLDDDRPSSS